jgi:hypothetical protein
MWLIIEAYFLLNKYQINTWTYASCWNFFVRASNSNLFFKKSSFKFKFEIWKYGSKRIKEGEEKIILLQTVEVLFILGLYWIFGRLKFKTEI